MLFRKRAQRKRRRIRKLRLLALVVVLLLLAAASFSVGLITAIAGQLPNLDPKRAQAGEVDGYIYADNGRTILAVLRGKEARVLVGWNDISPWMKHAIVDIEDKRFYEHRGVDLHGILRAVWADIRHKSTVQGGSTITQQFVKNSLIHNERTISRKLKEAALAWQLESGPGHWSKTRILTAYLNTIYLGNGAYGVETASKAYFGHSAKSLTLPEAALLAGIPADPSRWDPVTHPRAARARRRTVLLTMEQQGDISHADFVRASKAPLPKPEDVRVPGGPSPKAPYFTNYVKQLLVDRYHSSTVFGGGLRVRTSINLRVQQAARDAIAKWLTWPDAPSAALVALDPRDGRVLAMVGGNNFRKSQFNLAVQGERQPGSAFKPFVLANALEQGVAPGSTFVSRPITIYLDGTYWPVHNYEGSYLGPIDLQQATIHSDNSVYGQLTRLLGPENVVRTAHRLGIASPLEPYLSIGLGGQAVNPLEMARAFSAFANGGFRIDGSLKQLRNHPRAILAVGLKKSTGLDCGDRHVQCNERKARRVLREDTVAAENSLLQRVVTQGTGLRARLSDRPAAGKTGTTTDYGDAWFVGYTPQLVTAVWVGYPNKLVPMTTQFHGEPVAGGTFPAMIWKTFMEKALELPAVPGGHEVQYFEQPPAHAAGRPAERGTGARQRALQGHDHARVPADSGQARGLQAERGRGSERRREHGQARAAAARRAAADAVVRLQAREAGTAAERRAGAVPVARKALFVRPRDARRSAGSARGRPERRRAQAAKGACEVAQARSQPARDPVHARQARARRGAEATCRRRRGARPRDPPQRGKARLRKREPARP